MREIKNAIALFLAIVFVLATFAIAANAASTNEAVCKINAGNSMGSGTLIGTSIDGKTSLVISCYHVVGGNQFVKCTFKNAPGLESTPFPGRVVKLSSKWDLAAILIYNPGIAPVEIGDFTTKHPGIYSACGYGAGRYSAARGPVLSYDQHAIETRVNIYGGHSGGCLFDPWGRWCGVTNWSSNSSGPTGRGFTRSRTGVPLEQFTTEAVQQCGILSRLLNRGGGGGGGDCPGGVCPDPNVPAIPGQGYAPGFQPLTPLASQPGAVAPQVVPPATTVTVAPTITQPAPVPQPQKLPVAPAPVEADRLARLESMMAKIAGELGVDVDATEQDESGKLLATLPTVELSLRYPDGAVKTASIDLRQRVLKEFGADVPEEK